MKYLILFVALLSSSAYANQCKQFSFNQLQTMQRAYNYGEEHDLGWTLAAIVWQESSAGNKVVNWKDPSFGPFQIYLKTAASHEGFDWELDPRRALDVADKLLIDLEYGAGHAIKVLDHWKIRHSGNYRRMLSSYNAGVNWNSERGTKYANDVVYKLNFLRTYRCVQ